FGDGATNQAYFFECLNFAKVLELPVVFVCENNGYGEYTPFEAVTPGGIVPRAAAVELRTTEGDGRDLPAVRSGAAGGVQRVGRGLGRGGGGGGGAAGSRAGVRRGADVSVRGPLAQRPGQVSARR